MITITVSAELAQALITNLTIEVEALRVTATDLEAENARLGERVNTLMRISQDHADDAFIAKRENAEIKAELARVKGLVTLDQIDWYELGGKDFIPVIKTVRERTGLGLKEAKDAVENAYRDGKVWFAGGFVPSNCQ